MNFRDFIDDVARCVGFLSRIHVPQRHFVNHDGSLSRAVRAFPVAGILIALPSAALVAVFASVRIDPLFTAVVALAVQALVTGALHEDGLSDTADGFGGGKDRESALSIMRDSRIGTYGGVALVLSFALRASALAAIMPDLKPTSIGLVLLAVAALSRTAMVWHWSRLSPARKDGVAASVGEPDKDSTLFALASGLGSAVVLMLLNAPILATVLAVIAFAAVVIVFGDIVNNKIGGHTGDTIGATQQLTEIAVLGALALSL